MGVRRFRCGKTMIKGKQNDTSVGETAKNDETLYDAQSQDHHDWLIELRVF